MDDFQNTDKGNRKFERIARDFLKSENKRGITYIWHHNTMYRREPTRYVVEHHLADRLRRWMHNTNAGASNNTIGNVIPNIHTIRWLDHMEGQDMPFYVGEEEFPSEVIVFNNGILDLRKYMAGEVSVLKHTPRWISTVCLPYCFDENAPCPTWRKFLGEVFDDQRRVDLLQEWMGYCMTTDISYQKMLVMVGPPRAGKGTISSVLGGLVGQENSTGYSMLAFGERFGLSTLVGKNCAFIGEVDLRQEFSKNRILEKMNSVIGADPQMIERKGENFMPSVVLPTRFTIATNEMPSFLDASGALAARMLVLEFTKSFVGKEDKMLLSKLLAELPGIATWALEGLRRLRMNEKFTNDDAAVDAVRRKNSDAYAFLCDCLIVHRSYDAGNLEKVEFTDTWERVPVPHVRKRYENWCASKDKQQNFQWLARDLQTILPTFGRGPRRRMADGMGSVVDAWDGIGLKIQNA